MGQHFKTNNIDYVSFTVFLDRLLRSKFQVVHVAAPLVDNPANTDFDRDFLHPSVEGYIHKILVPHLSS
jgi:hypothetical protein